MYLPYSSARQTVAEQLPFLPFSVLSKVSDVFLRCEWSKGEAYLKDSKLSDGLLPVGLLFEGLLAEGLLAEGLLPEGLSYLKDSPT
jgi:hypothetical protein